MKLKTIATELSFSTKPLRDIGHVTPGSVKHLLFAAKVLREHGLTGLREFMRVFRETVEYERQMAEFAEIARRSHAAWKGGENEHG
jgi:hypothetical protein